MNTTASVTSLSLEDIIAKISRQGNKVDLSFLKDNPQAQTMLLLALLQTVNPASTATENTTATTPTPMNNLNHQQLGQLIAALYPTSSLSQTPKSNGWAIDESIAKPAKETKSAKKKVGRKPVTSDEDNSDDPKLKRKAQNRAAQRAFRERKENEVRQLEQKLKELEESLSTYKNVELAEENRKLKDSIAELRRENELIKASTTSFDKPLTAFLKDTDGERPSKLIRQNTRSASPNSSNSHNSYSPETEDEMNSRNSNKRSNSKSSSSGNSDISSIVFTPQMTIEDILNLDSTNSPMTTPSASSISTMPISNNIFTNDLFGSISYPIPMETATTMDYSKQLNDLLKEHRTTLSTDPSQFDFFYPLPSNTTAAIVPTAADNILMNTTDNSVPVSFGDTTTAAATAATMTGVETTETAKEDVATFKSENITNVWDKLSEHPRFSEFDLDLLCDEMKHKAVCTEPCNDTNATTHEKELLSLIEKHYPVE